MAVAFLTGCGTGAERACTGAAARTGVGLLIEAPLADEVSRATMKTCWGDTCEAPKLTLQPETRSEPIECTGSGPDDACGATAVPTGAKRAFADISDLPTSSVRVTVSLYRASGARVLHERITVTPKAVYPNGKQCDGDGWPQVQLVVEDGKLRAR